MGKAAIDRAQAWRRGFGVLATAAVLGTLALGMLAGAVIAQDAKPAGGEAGAAPSGALVPAPRWDPSGDAKPPAPAAAIPAGATPASTVTEARPSDEPPTSVAAPLPAAPLPSAPGPDGGSAQTAPPAIAAPAPTPDPAPAPAAVAAPTAPPVPSQSATPTVPTPVAVPVPRPVESKPAERGAAASGAANGLRLAAASGAYLAAQKKAIHAPFTAQFGAPVTVEPPAGGPAGAVLADLKAGRADWDIAELDAGLAEQACAADLIEPIDASRLPRGANGAEPAQDFIPGGLTACAVGSVAWSSLVVYDKRSFGPKAAAVPAQRATKTKRAAAGKPASLGAPTALAHLFDASGYPGKRGLRRDPKYLLEMALLADGAKPDEVYALLATDAGIDRALARLEPLRAEIVWLEGGRDAGRALIDRSVAMAMMYSGRAFQHAAVEGRPWALLWDGQIYTLDAWVIRKGARAAGTARDFVGFASEPARLTAQAQLFPYGPARLSSTAAASRHAVLRTDLAPYLPTTTAHLATALRFDARFWEANQARLAARFEAWTKGPTPAVAAPATPAAAEAPASETPAAKAE